MGYNSVADIFGYSGSLKALFSIQTNSRWRPPPSWIILNCHIPATAHSAHCAVIFAIARLSCFTYFSYLIKVLTNILHQKICKFARSFGATFPIFLRNFCHIFRATFGFFERNFLGGLAITRASIASRW